MNKKKRRAKRERTKKYKQRVHIAPADVKNAGISAQQMAKLMRVLVPGFFSELKK